MNGNNITPADGTMDFIYLAKVSLYKLTLLSTLDHTINGLTVTPALC